ncbi:hypothetical protein GCM10009676_20120 [Prauserella halophila]|uniref:Phosphoglycolate phosphatase n=2 Tax=Actinomycetes TaxID=1760 RepID=A0ABP4GYA9_9PSEU|nr:phosphoglycolate phosphatase [Prauserella halophila]
MIFDLDGTLVQTRLASWEVFRPISRRFGLGVDTAEEFYELFQNNFFESLRALCRDRATADEVERAFQQALESDYSPPLIPGMADVVKGLAPHCTLAVLSSNSTGVIRRILLDNDLAYCFGHVFGGDTETDKTQGVHRFLADAARGVGRRCQPAYDEACDCSAIGDTALVTDTVGDIVAARQAGIRAVGVAWGMHTSAELREAGADFVAIWPQELLGLVGPTCHDRCTPNTAAPAETSEAAPAPAGTSEAAPALAETLARTVEIRRARRRERSQPRPSTTSQAVQAVNQPAARPEVLDAVRRILR